MKKLKMARSVTFTFEEGCNKYLENCRQRNLREGMVNHQRRSYVQFYKFFDRNMLVSKITQKKYNEYILFLRSYIDNDLINFHQNNIKKYNKKYQKSFVISQNNTTSSKPL